MPFFYFILHIVKSHQSFFLNFVQEGKKVKIFISMLYINNYQNNNQILQGEGIINDQYIQTVILNNKQFEYRLSLYIYIPSLQNLLYTMSKNKLKFQNNKVKLLIKRLDYTKDSGIIFLLRVNGHCNRSKQTKT